MRISLYMCAIIWLSIATIYAEEGGRFENSTLSVDYPSTVILNETDFDFGPEYLYRFTIDGAPVLIGMQSDLQTNRPQLLEHTKNNVMRYLDDATSTSFTTYGSLDRCEGLKLTGTAKHPKFTGEISVYLVTFATSNKTVILIGIAPSNDPRFEQALQSMSRSIKLKK